ncbi:MAG: succinyl-CoA synthetase subunit beta [Syntrophorhabdus sp. PtaU1.Bin153]|nr:MAG: succinyl-CoA synthetase subunit beta [Syntrophorhabdus sp. PtaU1.Bin153]
MLDALFKPKAVAVIGASAKELHIGNQIIRNLLEFGYKGSVYPINPKAGEIRGVKAYKSILDVPTEVDVVHMAIPAPFVPQAIEDCGRKGVKLVILNGGGFAETGPAGAAIERDCIVRAREHGIRIFGPNCQGIINTDPEVRAYCNFTFTKPEPGSISIVALSGGVASLIHQAFADMGVGTRLYASNGNACDVSIPEIIQYFGNDEKTRAIVLYVEGLRDASRFLEVVRKVAAKKPILAMKAGRTEEGAKAASSHTGGIAKQEMATDLIFEKAGILSFRDEAELCQAGAVFASQPIPRGNRVGVITNTGGPAVIATDALVAGGLTIPALSGQAKEVLASTLFPEASIDNPLDVLATAEGEHFRAAMDTMMDEDQVDSIYINFVTAPFVNTENIAREIVEVNRQQRKPIICNLMTDKGQWTETVRILKDGNVPIYDFPGAAAKALAALTRYGEIRKRKAGKPQLFRDVDQWTARTIVEQAQSAGRTMLSAAEVYGILRAYNIPVAEWRIAGNAEEAEECATEIGYPVVVKADCGSLLHKSDRGGVALNLQNGRSVRGAVNRMRKRFDAQDLKFLVQEYLPGGKEIIVGTKAEPGLGHLVMFGVGGVHVEVLQDTVFKLSPVTPAEAQEMFRSLKASPLLGSVRGKRGVGRKEITRIIQRVSQLVTEVPEIQEMDINPIIAYEDHVCAVDARISLSGG